MEPMNGRDALVTATRGYARATIPDEPWNDDASVAAIIESRGPGTIWAIARTSRLVCIPWPNEEAPPGVEVWT